MTENENVTVIIHNSNVQNGEGCFSGCGAVFFAFIVLALISSAIGSCSGDADASSVAVGTQAVMTG